MLLECGFKVKATHCAPGLLGPQHFVGTQNFIGDSYITSLAKHIYIQEEHSGVQDSFTNLLSLHNKIKMQ